MVGIKPFPGKPGRKPKGRVSINVFLDPGILDLIEHVPYGSRSDKINRIIAEWREIKESVVAKRARV